LPLKTLFFITFQINQIDANQVACKHVLIFLQKTMRVHKIGMPTKLHYHEEHTWSPTRKWCHSKPHKTWGNSVIYDAWISSIAPQPTEHNRKSLHKYPRIKRLNFVDNLSLINRQAKVETFDGSSLFQLRLLWEDVSRGYMWINRW
jgi:hypothetical protein